MCVVRKEELVYDDETVVFTIENGGFQNMILSISRGTGGFRCQYEYRRSGSSHLGLRSVPEVHVKISNPGGGFLVDIGHLSDANHRLASANY